MLPPLCVTHFVLRDARSITTTPNVRTRASHKQPIKNRPARLAAVRWQWLVLAADRAAVMVVARRRRAVRRGVITVADPVAAAAAAAAATRLLRRRVERRRELRRERGVGAELRGGIRCEARFDKTLKMKRGSTRPLRHLLAGSVQTDTIRSTGTACSPPGVDVERSVGANHLGSGRVWVSTTCDDRRQALWW